jgi:hypothetical protein
MRSFFQPEMRACTAAAPTASALTAVAPCPRCSLIRDSLSWASSRENPDLRPARSGPDLRIFSPRVWKVEMTSPRVSRPETSPETRARISRAALLVKVTAHTRRAGMPQSRMR